MGIFDNLFGNLTGETGLEASAQTRALMAEFLRNQFTQLQEGEAGGRATLEGGRAGALEALGGGFEQSRDALLQGAGPNAFTSEGGLAYDAWRAPQDWGQQGINELNRLYGDAQGYYDPLRTAGQAYGAERRGYADMSRNALGLGGQAGIDEATQAFREGPGYQFALNQGLESIARNQNRAGMLASGNQMQESQRYGQGLADQEFDDWLNRLQRGEQQYGGLESGALQNYGAGMTGAALTTGGRIADINQNVGNRTQDFQIGLGNRLAESWRQQGMAEADIERNMAQLQATSQLGYRGLETDLIRALAAPTSSTFQQGANALNNAGNNVAGLFGSIARAFAGL